MAPRAAANFVLAVQMPPGTITSTASCLLLGRRVQKNAKQVRIASALPQSITWFCQQNLPVLCRLLPCEGHA